MHTNVKSFKVYCLPLTKNKIDILKNMVNEYAVFYNYAANLIPSLKGTKYLSHSNPSELYTKWIKSSILEYKHIKSIDAFNAIKDAVANYKASGNKCEIVEPNIIKFEGSRYKIIKYKDNYAILINDRKNPLYLPLVTGKWLELVEHLDYIISSKTNQGSIVYSLKNNSISIPLKTEQTKKYNKNTEIETIIGIDRGLNNHVVLSAIDKNKNVLKVKLFGGKGDYDIIRRMGYLNDKKKESGKEINNRINNYTETLTHIISKQIVDFVIQFPNPLVIMEDLSSMKKKKLRHKYGGKATKSQRKMVSKWTYGKIKTKLEYKLKARGIRIKEVNPMYTSQICNRCGVIGIRDGIHFKCETGKCSLGIGSNPINTIGQYNSDINGSINIALRGFYSLYGYKKGTVSEPNGQPNENIMNPIPTEMTGIDGINTRKSETVDRETNIQNIGSILNGSVQSMVEIPPRDCVSENGFSSCYIINNKNTGRTELANKTDSGGMLLMS